MIIGDLFNPRKDDLRMTKRRYVVFEGIDGGGKDSQADLLEEYYQNQGNSVLRVAEPDDTTPIGKIIRQHLSSGKNMKAHVFLFLADRTILLENKIAPALEEGKAVICARSFLSTLVYQHDLWPSYFLWDLHKHIEIWPTDIIVLDLSPAESMKRVNKRVREKEVYEKTQNLEKYRKRYLDLAQKSLGGLLDTTFHVVDATGSPEEVHQRVLTALNEGN